MHLKTVFTFIDIFIFDVRFKGFQTNWNMKMILILRSLSSTLFDFSFKGFQVHCLGMCNQFDFWFKGFQSSFSSFDFSFKGTST